MSVFLPENIKFLSKIRVKSLVKVKQLQWEAGQTLEERALILKRVLSNRELTADCKSHQAALRHVTICRLIWFSLTLSEARVFVRSKKMDCGFNLNFTEQIRQKHEAIKGDGIGERRVKGIDPDLIEKKVKAEKLMPESRQHSREWAAQGGG